MLINSNKKPKLDTPLVEDIYSYNECMFNIEGHLEKIWKESIQAKRPCTSK